MSFKNRIKKTPSTNISAASHAVSCTTGVTTYLVDGYQVSLADGYTSGNGLSTDGYGTMPSTCIYCGGAGNLVVTMVSGETLTFAVGPYSYHPIQCTIVHAASTATQIIALFNRTD